MFFHLPFFLQCRIFIKYNITEARKHCQGGMKTFNVHEHLIIISIFGPEDEEFHVCY